MNMIHVHIYIHVHVHVSVYMLLFVFIQLAATWEHTPPHFLQLDITSLLSPNDNSINEVNTTGTYVYSGTYL